MNPKNTQYINLFDNREVEHWLRKWSIDANQLNNAIMQTGNTNVTELESHLRAQGQLGLPFGKIFHYFRNVIATR